MKQYLFNKIPPGTIKNNMMRVFRFLTLVIALTLQTKIYAAGTYLFSRGDDEITWESPSFRCQVRYYKDDISDSFWDEAPELWINDELVMTLSDLHIEGDDYAQDIRAYDKDWKSYNTNDYYIVLFDPYNEGDDVLNVGIEILPKRMKAGQQYKVQVKGWWCQNRNVDPTVWYDLTWDKTPTVPDYFDKAGDYSRPAPSVIQYNKNNITQYKNWHYEFGFYKNSDYSDYNKFARISLPTNLGSTDNLVRWEGNSNSKKTTIYHKSYLINDSQPYGTNDTPKRGTVTFYKEYGATSVDGYIKADNVYATTNKWKKQVELTWESASDYEDAKSQGTWLIQRYIKSIGSSSTENIAEVSSSTYKYTDKSTNLSYDVDYVYFVIFMPKDWQSGNYAPDLTDFAETIISRNYSMTINSTSLENSVKINVEGEELKGTDQYTFMLMRKKEEDTTWEQIHEYKVINKANVKFEYEDKNIPSPCDVFIYKAEIFMMDTTFTSDLCYGNLLGTTKITNITATKGLYNNVVKVNWDVDQIGTAPTRFSLSRRLINDTKNNSWDDIYSTTGTSSVYTFEDVTAEQGKYYEYRIGYSYACEESQNMIYSQKADGFVLSTGVVSGQLTYMTGNAAEGVKINLSYADDANREIKAQFSSLKVENGGGILYEPTDNSENKILYGNDRSFSVQMWAKYRIEDSNEELTTKPQLTLFETESGARLYIQTGNETENGIYLYTPENSTGEFLNLNVKPNEYYHYTLSYNHEYNEWTLYIIDRDEELRSHKFTSKHEFSNHHSVIFGKSFSDETDKQFNGYIDEIRWWNKVLTERDIQKNYGHLLSGTESGLRLYYPLDENINQQRVAYDYSKTSGVANDAHGKILGGAVPCDNIPSEEQFGLYAVTDEYGNYTIMGVPLTSEGINYEITPTKGIHKFTPAKTTRFISANSMIHDGINFTDVSSFPVSGKIYYENTTHPVAGVSIKVDGEYSMSSDGKISVTDDKGEFTISVPIGEHYISLEKDGHTFANDGFYPAKINNEIQTVYFDREIKNLTFTDKTKAIVVGRVSGGKIENAKPLGFGIGEANIGKAVIQLTTGYNMNMVQAEGSTDYEYNTDTLYYGLASDSIKGCKAYVGTNTEDGVRTITIETDPTNGEFAVLLPPAEYRVTYATIPSSGHKFENLPTINVRVGEEFVKHDSLLVGSENLKFEYHASLKLNQRNNCILKVSDRGTGSNAYGEEYWVNPNKNKKDLTTQDSIRIYTLEGENKENVNYIYDYPIYFQNGDYELDLYSYEEYVNMDDPDNPVYTQVPNKGAVVIINNEFGDGVAVDKEGNILQKSEREVELDSLGHGIYHFKGGLPNIQGDYSLSMNITYQVDENSLSWSENGKFKAILLGALPTGNNFVTKGPDKVIGVLRDPPGSNSYTSWEKGHTITNSTKTFGNFSYNGALHGISSLGASVAAYTGFAGIGTVTKMDAYVQLSGGLDVGYNFNKDNTGTTKVTLSESISTSNNENYVGGMADVFVGIGTNLTFGEARAVGFNMKADSTYDIDLMETVTMGEEFTTSFQYTQNYIETNVIPNLKKLRNAKLLPKGSPETNSTNSFIYISKLDETDPKYGSSNYDKQIWGDNAIVWDSENLEKSYNGPSYIIIPPTSSSLNQKDEIDSIQFYNNYIDGWIYELRQNDSIKVAAINKENYSTEGANGTEEEMLNKYPQLKERNISFDGGTTYQGTWQEINDTIENTTHKGNIGILLNVAFATKLWKIGTIWDVKFNPSGGGGKTNTEGNTGIETVKYILADTGFDAFTVDVYTRINEKSPIFYTHGGKSRCPYEGEVKTKYYEPGEHTLAVATQKIEYPRITCDESVKTGVPSETAAYFKVNLRNFSETNTPMWYDLSLVEDSNPNGLEISMDGGPVGGSFLIEGGDSIEKTITIKQGNPSILNYDNIRLRLSSQCQNNPFGPFGEISDTVSLSVQFVPSCSDIRLQVSNPILNKTTGSKLQLTIDRYDLNRTSLEALEVQYKTPSDTIWNTIKKYVTKKELMDGNSEYLDKNNSNEDVSQRVIEFDMSNSGVYPDQMYLFRAITTCNFGDGPVYNESEEVTVTKDMVSPTIIAVPNPADGVINSDDEISIVFNEDILPSSITENKIKVTGVLNESRIEHSVALKCIDNKGAHTESIIDINKASFSVNLWMNYNVAGRILSHGTAEKYFSIEVDEQSHLVINNNGKKIISKEIIPTDTWVFLSLSCDQENETKVTADIAYGENTVSMFSNEPIDAYSGHGRLHIGKGLSGAIHEVSLWNYARTATEAFSEMYSAKRPFTTGLSGYWKLNEGRGNVATDYARGRYLILEDENAWLLNNVNKALELKDHQFGVIDISRRTTTDEDNYLIEFWFKAVTPKDTATIMSVGNGLLKLRYAENKIELATEQKVHYINTADCLDGNWHHIAINVLKKALGSAIVYLDGNAVYQMSAKEIPAMASDQILLGAEREIIALGNDMYKYVYDKFFEGCFDEFRYWKGYHSAGFIKNNMNHRVTDGAIGLAAYYPFEKQIIDDYNQTQYVASLADHSSLEDVDLMIKTGESGTENATTSWETNNTPALKAAPLTENVDFTYVADERKLLIKLEEEPVRLEGTTLTFKVSEIRDKNNNISEDITWVATVKQNQLSWDSESVNIEKEMDEPTTFKATISNNGGTVRYWSIINLPSWMEVDMQAGSLKPESTQDITFTVHQSTPIGRYEETIYLVDQDLISIPLVVNVQSKGFCPDWHVNPDDFESSMSFVGQLIIDGVHCDDKDDMIAAFNNGKCVAVAHPEYIKRYDSFYIMMNIYGAPANSTDTITFKVYDASTGIVYPSINSSTVFTYAADAVVGNMNEPVILTIDNMIQQNLNLKKGWKWITFNVQPKDCSVNSVMKNTNGKAYVIKNKEYSDTQYSNGGWVGNLGTITPNKMYKINSLTDFTHSIIGEQLNIAESPIILKKGWNWIGYAPTTSMSVKEAFAQANPKEGDIIKGQYEFSIYTDYEWIGTLEGMNPGEGYIYMSNIGEKDSVKFSYPSFTVKKRNGNNSFISNKYGLTNSYSGNMNLIATVMNGEEVVSDAQVHIYSNDTLVASSEIGIANDLHFITVLGQGYGSKLRVIVTRNGMENVSADELYFSEDAVIGSPKEPYIIQLDGKSAMNSITMKQDENFVTITSVHPLSTVTMYNSGGQIVHNESSTDNQVRISTTSLAQGSYIIVIKAANGSQRTFKILK